MTKFLLFLKKHFIFQLFQSDFQLKKHLGLLIESGIEILIVNHGDQNNEGG